MATMIDNDGKRELIPGNISPGVVQVGEQFLRVEKQLENDIHIVGMRTSVSPRAAMEKITRPVGPGDCWAVMRQGQTSPDGTLRVYFVADER